MLKPSRTFCLQDGKARRAFTALAAAAACAWTVTAPADDWPQWQGADRSAMSGERGLLKEWTPDGPPLAWKVDGLGGGQSTPSVADGRIYQFRYRPWDVALGSLLTLVGALLAVVLWRPGFASKARARIRARRPASEEAGERDGGSPEPEEPKGSGVNQAREA